jgi:hypothetical protein
MQSGEFPFSAVCVIHLLMPMKYKHPSNKGKIPSDEIGSRGYDGECGVDEVRSTGV